MAVYAPGDDPPPNAVDPGMWARLMGYAGALSPIGSAQADTLTRAPNPLNRPSPVPAVLQGGGPPVPPAMLGGGQPPSPTNPLTQPSPVDPRLVGGGPPVDADTLARIKASIVGGGGSSGGAGASMPFPQNDQVAAQRGMPAPPGYGPETTHMPYPGQVDPKGVFAPSSPALVGQTPAITARIPAATIDPRMRGEVAPAASSNMFTPITRPNMDPGTGGGMLGFGGALAAPAGPRGTGGPPQMTALDLSGLFRGGQPATAAPAQPRTKIDVGKIPPGMRAEVPPDATSKAPSDYGPLQRGRNWKLKNNNPDLYR